MKQMVGTPMMIIVGTNSFLPISLTIFYQQKGDPRVSIWLIIKMLSKDLKLFFRRQQQ